MSDDIREALAEALRATDPEPYMPGNWEDVAYYRGFADALLASDAVERIKAEAWEEGYEAGSEDEANVYPQRQSAANPYRAALDGADQ